MINSHGELCVPEPEHVILEKLYDRISIAFSEEVIKDIDANVWIIDGNIKRAIVQFDKYTWAEKLQDNFILESHYSSWWDRFKDEKMPEWFKKRYPIKRDYTRHVWKRYAKFPKFKWFSDREKEEFVILETMKTMEVI